MFEIGHQHATRPHAHAAGDGGPLGVPLAVGGSGAPNTKNTAGLTINQGGADDAALSIKSSDVAHGMTTLSETDTFFEFAKSVPGSGGVDIVGYSEDAIGLSFVARVTNGNTVKTTSAAAPFQLQGAKKTGTTVGALGANENIFAVYDGSSARLVFDVEGDMFINGSAVSDKVGGGVWYLNDTSNAKSTQGLTLNQGANDDEVLAFKSADVAHGITNQSETDTYAAFQKYDGAAGGLVVKAFSEATEAFQVWPMQTTEATGKTSTAGASMRIDSYKKNGTGLAAHGADANILAIGSNGATFYLFDADGDFQAKRKVYPGTDAGVLQTAAGLMGGTGAPNNANGADGDFYFRSDGGAGTSIYHRRAGAWVGIV